MIRKSFKDPGHDCVRHPCGRGLCGVTPGGSHGIGCEMWNYVVSDGDVAILLPVFSGVFPESVPKSTRDDLNRIHAGVMQVHASFPIDRESMTRAPKSEKCEWLDGKPCLYIESYGLHAEELLKTIGVPNSFERPEPWWVALEAWLAKEAAELRTQRADLLWERCNACDGCGTVARKAKVQA